MRGNLYGTTWRQFVVGQWLRVSTRVSTNPYGYLFSPAQGRPECIRLYLWFTRSRKFLLRGGPGCSGHPAFPAPSTLEEGDNEQSSGEMPSRERGCMSLRLHVSPPLAMTGCAV